MLWNTNNVRPSRGPYSVMAKYRPFGSCTRLAPSCAAMNHNTMHNAVMESIGQRARQGVIPSSSSNMCSGGEYVVRYNAMPPKAVMFSPRKTPNALVPMPMVRLPAFVPAPAPAPATRRQATGRVIEWMPTACARSTARGCVHARHDTPGRMTSRPIARSDLFDTLHTVRSPKARRTALIGAGGTRTANANVAPRNKSHKDVSAHAAASCAAPTCAARSSSATSRQRGSPWRQGTGCGNNVRIMAEEVKEDGSLGCSLRLVTFNIRNTTDRYAERRDLIVSALAEFGGDLIGLQEVSFHDGPPTSTRTHDDPTQAEGLVRDAFGSIGSSDTIGGNVAAAPPATAAAAAVAAGSSCNAAPAKAQTKEEASGTASAAVVDGQPRVYHVALHTPFPAPPTDPSFSIDGNAIVACGRSGMAVLQHDYIHLSDVRSAHRVLVDLPGGAGRLWFANTHLHHELGDASHVELRRSQSQALCEWMKAAETRADHCVIVGDFNASPSEPA